MGIRTRPESDADRAAVLEELAGLRADVKALRTEREDRAELNGLRDAVEKLKREKASLVEDNDRKIRETEHKVGLLKTKQDHDIAHAKRTTELEVREANLAADKERFYPGDGVPAGAASGRGRPGGARPERHPRAPPRHHRGTRRGRCGQGGGLTWLPATRTRARTPSWYITTSTTSSPYYINTNITSGVNGITSGAIWTEPAPPRKPTPLEWLDAEVERTCALARAA